MPEKHLARQGVFGFFLRLGDSPWRGARTTRRVMTSGQPYHTLARQVVDLATCALGRRLGARDPGMTARDLVDPDSVLVRSRHPAEDLTRVVADLVRHLLLLSFSISQNSLQVAGPFVRLPAGVVPAHPLGDAVEHRLDPADVARVVGLRATGLGATGNNQLAGKRVRARAYCVCA